MKIRKIKKGEIEFLDSMLYTAIFVPPGHPAPPKDIIRNASLAKYIDNWGKDPFDIALVAEANIGLIGAIWGRLFTHSEKGYGFVDDQTPEITIAIEPAFRNQGIGTKMINAFVSEYRKIGVEQLSLSVDKANIALGLYEKMGFEHFRDEGTSLTMKKDLTTIA